MDNSAVDGKTTRSGRERTVGVDGGRDLGSGFHDAAGAARARHLGAWFPGVRPLDFDGDTLLLSVPSSLAAERIRSSYSGMLTDAIRDSTGVTIRLELVVETDPKEREAITLAPPPVAVVGRRSRAVRRRRARPAAHPSPLRG